MPDTPVSSVFASLHKGLLSIEAGGQHANWSLDTVIGHAVAKALIARKKGYRIMFIGNGGSAAIASHLAEDFLKAGRFATMSFNDAAQLTCLANDLGYESVFRVPIERHGKAGDILFAISSSGKSENILSGARAARAADMEVITLSGFKPDNPLRRLGHLNFYVPSEEYGTVEVAHLAICHAILDRVVAAHE